MLTTSRWSWLWPLVGLIASVAMADVPNRTDFLQVHSLTDLDPAAVCLDGSPAMYYTDKRDNVNASKWVIWLQGGGACAPKEMCLALLAEDPIMTYAYPSSNFWPPTLPGQNLLSQSPEENAALHDAVHVYVPYCSQDLWIGSNMENVSEAGQLLYFRGRDILAALLIDLTMKFGFSGVEQLVLAGASAGATGVLQSARRVRVFLDDVAQMTGRAAASLDLICDSGFFVDLESFRPGWGGAEKHPFENLLYEANYLWRPEFDAACSKVLGVARHMCVAASEIWRHVVDIPNTRLLFLQAQYDAYFLHAFAGLDESEDPEPVFINSYIEQYGSEMRSFLHALRFHPRVSLFSPACVSHVYNYPVPFLGLSSLPRDAVIGTMSISSPLNADIVEETRIGELSMMDAMNHFVKHTNPDCSDTSANGTTNECTIHADQERETGDYFYISDSCASLFCNEQCPSHITITERTVLFSIALRRAIITCVLVLLLGAVIHFFVVQYQINQYKSKYREYWRQHSRRRKRIPTLIDVMKHSTTSKELNVSLRNLNYFRKRRQLSHHHHHKTRKQSWRDWVPLYHWFSSIGPRVLVGFFCCRAQERSEIQLLKGVTMSVKPGEVTAIMGPSGCGKSTLLDILCLMRTTGRIEGSHFINGMDTTKFPTLRQYLKNNLGYVRQIDEFFPELTVREYLSYMAMLTLPQHMSFELKQERVHQVIQAMMLSFRKDTPVGDGGRTIEGGLSGGQLRRLSVAAALLRMPPMLVLDEPTSGLDSSSSKLMVNCLSELARNTGCMVILTIHQPRIELYDRFDRIVVMADGEVLFSEKVDVMMRMFSVPKNANPGDFVIDILDDDNDDTVQKLCNRWETSEEYAKIDAEITESIVVSMDAARQKQFAVVLSTNAYLSGNYSSSRPISVSEAECYWTAMCNARKKSWWEHYRRSVCVLFASIFLGFIFYDIESKVNRWENRVSLLYLYAAMCPLLQNTFEVKPWFTEKKMWDRAFQAGQIGWVEFLRSRLYRMWVWGILDTICMISPVYWMAGLNEDKDRFGQTLLLMVLYTLVFNAYIVLVAITLNDELTTSFLTAVYMGFCGVFSGFVIRYGSIPSYLQWLPDVLAGYWAFVGVMNSDLRGTSYPCEASKMVCDAQVGDTVIEMLELDRYDQITCITALFFNLFLFLGFAVPFFWYSFVRDTKLERLDVTVNKEMQAQLHVVTMNSTVSLKKGDHVNIIKPGPHHLWRAVVVEPHCVWNAVYHKFLCLKVRCEKDGAERTFAKKDVILWDERTATAAACAASHPGILSRQRGHTRSSLSSRNDTPRSKYTQALKDAEEEIASTQTAPAEAPGLFRPPSPFHRPPTPTMLSPKGKASHESLLKMWSHARRRSDVFHDTVAVPAPIRQSYQKGGSMQSATGPGPGPDGGVKERLTKDIEANGKSQVEKMVQLKLLREMARHTMSMKYAYVRRLRGMNSWLQMPKMSLKTLNTYVIDLRARGVDQAEENFWIVDLLILFGLLAAMTSDIEVAWIYIPYICVTMVVLGWPLYMKMSLAGAMMVNYNHEFYMYSFDVILTIADVMCLVMIRDRIEQIWISIGLCSVRKIIRWLKMRLSNEVTSQIRNDEAEHRNDATDWLSGLERIGPRLRRLAKKSNGQKKQYQGVVKRASLMGIVARRLSSAKRPPSPPGTPPGLGGPPGLPSAGSSFSSAHSSPFSSPRKTERKAVSNTPRRTPAPPGLPGGHQSGAPPPPGLEVDTSTPPSTRGAAPGLFGVSASSPKGALEQEHMPLIPKTSTTSKNVEYT